MKCFQLQNKLKIKKFIQNFKTDPKSYAAKDGALFIRRGNGFDFKAYNAAGGKNGKRTNWRSSRRDAFGPVSGGDRHLPLQPPLPRLNTDGRMSRPV